MSNRVVHFEIHADDPERAAAFYRAAFEWEVTKWEGGSMEYWMVMTAPKDSPEPGINGGLMHRRSAPPVDGQALNAFVCTVNVQNFDETHEKIVKAGGTVALPKMPLPGMAWLGYYKDTEGNIFGIHQEDKNAK